MSILFCAPPTFLVAFSKKLYYCHSFQIFFLFFWYQRRHIEELIITPHFLLFWRYLSSGNINYSVKPLWTYQETQNSGWYFRTNFMAQCKLIKLHCYSGFIAIASFFCKKQLFTASLYCCTPNYFQLFVQSIYISICQNWFQDFFTAFADIQHFTVCYILLSDICLMLHLSSNSSRACSYCRILCSSFV